MVVFVWMMDIVSNGNAYLDFVIFFLRRLRFALASNLVICGLFDPLRLVLFFDRVSQEQSLF